ncbi:MAG: VOC family protein [Bacillota bacterium]
MILILHKRPIKNVRIIDPDHIELNVQNVVETARFYKITIGFEEVFIFNHWAVLQSKEIDLEQPGSLRLVQNKKDTKAINLSTNSPGIILNVQKRLKALNLKVRNEPDSNNPENLRISFSDPAGYHVNFNLHSR